MGGHANSMESVSWLGFEPRNQVLQEVNRSLGEIQNEEHCALMRYCAIAAHCIIGHSTLLLPLILKQGRLCELYLSAWFRK